MSHYPGNYPPQQGGYPGQYPPQQAGYPPQQGGYPPQQGGYPGQYPPPQQGGYPPQQGGYPGQYPPPQQGGYPGQYGSQPVQGLQQQKYPMTNAPPPAPYYGAPAPAPYPAPYATGAPFSPPPPYPAPVPYAAAPAYPVAVAAPVAVATPVAVGVPYPVGYGMRFLLQFKARGLDRKDVFSKSDPFLALSASCHPGGYITHHQVKANRHETKHARFKKFGEHSKNWRVIARTETVRNCQHPTWQPFYVDLYQLCGGNMDGSFKIEVWDSDDHTHHDFIGSAVTTIRDLQVMREIRLINKSRIGIFNTSGTIEVLQCSPA